jgi:DNA repair protein RadC
MVVNEPAGNGMRMLDHIIIGDGQYYSFTDEGMIE